MADTRAKLTLSGDTAVELDVLKDTLGQDVIDIRTLDLKGVFTPDPGFTSIASCESKVTFIDGDGGILLCRGFPIDQLATDSDYLGICYILLNGEKPTQEQYDEFKATVTRYTMIHERVTRLFHAFRRDSHPMVVMRGITGALVVFYHDLLDVNSPRHHEITAFRLLPKMPTMAAMCCEYSTGQPFVYPRNDLFYADSFLSTVFSTSCKPYEVNPILERAVDRILILYADHEQDVSTSTVCTVGSSGTNSSACITAGIVPLWGPTYGGVNEAVLKMLEEIGSIRHILEFVRCAKDKNDSFCLMGPDHRVYKNYDPRTIVMREICHEVLKELGTRDNLPGVTMELKNTALNDPCFIEKKLHPNVGFYSDIILKAMGIPSFTFTVIFVMARIVGWIAHWSEMHSDGVKTARPHQPCTGYEKCDFKSDIKH